MFSEGLNLRAHWNGSFYLSPSFFLPPLNDSIKIFGVNELDAELKGVAPKRVKGIISS